MNRITIFGILVAGCLVILLCLQRCIKKNNCVIFIKAVIFVIYLGGYLYFTLFSREMGDNLRIRLQVLRSYRIAFTFDSGFLHAIKQIFTEGPRVGFNSIHIESTETFEGIVLNILLFVPFGYILPCIFSKLRKALWGVILIGFFCSLLTETIQLITYLGWFDLDDLLNNTIGCIMGVLFYRVLLRERKEDGAFED